MKYMAEFRDPELAKKLQRALAFETRATRAPIRIMEFCGGHTISLLKYGIPDLLPDMIEMVSGPGCPVCVTSKGEIDSAIKLAKREEVILTSFGDMIRVPGTTKSLRDAKAEGLDIRVVYSPNDAVKIAQDNPGRKVVFFAVGFETTAPVTAASVKLAEAKGVKNYFVIGAHKTTPGVLSALLAEEVKIDAFVCPGHVTTITGTDVYRILTDAGRPCVVSGFEPLDIMTSILMIVKQVNRDVAETEIEYSRVATHEGNRHAQSMMNEVFAPVDALWRGLGTIPLSGLKTHGAYERFDACKEFDMEITLDDSETKGCICGKVLRGLNKPNDCKLFKTACTPDNPVGACMVSDEGTCSIYYRFGNKGKELVEV
jgi:hydrogenase expression/formation protein HypD